MKQHCNYHPTQPAHWYCPRCQFAYCSDCIIKRKKGGYHENENIHLCPKCNIETKWIGAANLILPFWNRLPKFFTYPLSPQPLALMTAMTIVSTIFSGSGLLSLLIQVVVWAVMLKYAFEALKATAKGDLTPPKINSRTISEDIHQVFKQVGIFIIIGIAVAWLTAHAGIIVGILYLIFSAAFVPAMIILLVTTGSLLQAVNPLMFTKLAFRIGWGYLLMYFFLVLLYSAPAVLAQYIIKYLPIGLHLILFSLAKNYYTIVSYHLMGYVILQYHEEIGYEVDYENFRDPATGNEKVDQDENSQILNQVNILVKEGKLDEAITFIKEQTKANGITNLELSERYDNLLKLRKRTTERLEHCVTHLYLLSQNNQKTKTCQLYAKCLSLDRNFTPNPPTLIKIGQWLNESGKAKAAIKTYNRLIKAYPMDSLVPKAYFRSAQIFHDRLMRTDQARNILKALIRKYPDHEIIPQIKAYLGHLEI